jgi:hypothetical protein
MSSDDTHRQGCLPSPYPDPYTSGLRVRGRARGQDSLRDHGEAASASRGYVRSIGAALACPDSPVAPMCALGVVEAQVLLRAFDLRQPREVGPPEDHPPVLGEGDALEPLHDAIRQGMPRPRAPRLDPLRLAGDAEAGTPFGTVARQHRPHPMPSAAMGRQHPAQPEAGGEGGLRGAHDDLRDPVRARRITGRQLPDSGHPFQVPDVETIERDQVPGALGLDMGPHAALGVLGDQFPGSRGPCLPAGPGAPSGSAARATPGSCTPARRDHPAAVGPAPKLIADRLRAVGRGCSPASP